MFEEIVLESEQIVLLTSLIEMIRGIPREKRIKFIGYNIIDGTARITHPHSKTKEIDTLPGDIESLDHEGLINLSSQDPYHFRFDITTKGLRYYEYLQTAEKTVPVRIEKPVRNFLNGDRFPNIYPAAFDKWSKAESKLWSNDTQDELSIVGHLCREAMQEFVTALVERYKPPAIDNIKAHDRARLRAVINYREKSLSSTLAPFLDALITYWGTLSELVQRQEHSGQKEGQPVTWDDAKRIVFHTAVIFLEIDKALSTTA
jgi:hypothetical protein